jgi:hypothetical protein
MVIIWNVKHEANSAKFQGNEMLDTELASECAPCYFLEYLTDGPENVSAELKVDLMWRETEFHIRIIKHPKEPTIILHLIRKSSLKMCIQH